MRRSLILAALAGAAITLPAVAQKKIAVLTFDQRQVQNGFNDTFGRTDVNLGRSLANLIGRRVGDAGGFTIVEVSTIVPYEADPSVAAAAGRSVGADAVIAGSILGFGSQSGTAGVSGPSVGGVRLGIGRRTTVAVVSMEARLIDVASGQMLALIPASQTANRSGLALFARVPGLISADGIIDMTKDEFQRSLLGEATNAAVAQLVTGVSGQTSRIGTMGAPSAPAAPSASASTPMRANAAPAVAMSAGVPTGAVAIPSGPFAWAPYQFRGSEHFRYEVRQTEDNETKNGFYSLDFTPAGTGNVRMAVRGQLGDDETSNTVTLPVAQPGQPVQMGMGMGQLMAMGPLGIMLFNPTSWIMLGGRQLTIGDEWSNRSGGESMSVKVERGCEHAGQGGVLVVTKVNNNVASESCLSPNVALPLRILMQSEGGNRMEMMLTEYRP